MFHDHHDDQMVTAPTLFAILGASVMAVILLIIVLMHFKGVL